jgi:hypothetical protein
LERTRRRCRANTKIISMKTTTLIVFTCWVTVPFNLYSQTLRLGKNKLEAVKVSASMTKLTGKEVVRVIKDSNLNQADLPTYAKVNGIDFSNGTIEVKVLSRLLPTAPPTARGFIGIAFRINDSDSKFESIYIRPTNGRANDQVRRNHSIQYFSFPDYPFDRLRKEAPEKYESYADMGLNEWITLRIVVKDSEAKLFINNNKQPSLIVNDLKHGASASGTIGLWVDMGTEGFFSDLKIQPDK